MIRTGVVWRSEVPVGLSSAGRDALRCLGLRTAVDLRTVLETGQDPPDLGSAEVRLHQLPLFGSDFRDHDAMGLRELYEEVLETRGQQFAAIARLLSDPRALPAIIFCSAGKDRTGLTAAVLLAAVGVPRSHIVSDYALTESMLSPAARAAATQRALASGMTEQALAVKSGSPPERMHEVLDRLERAGGARAYLLRHGLTAAEADSLHRSLVTPGQ